MRSRWCAALICLSAVASAAWLSGAGGKAEPVWVEVAPSVLRTARPPFGYALVDGKAAWLIDAPHGPDGLKNAGVEAVETILLTHHHRDTCAATKSMRAARIPVRAAKVAAEWLEPTTVRALWQSAIPLRDSRADIYLALPEGLDGIDCSLADGQNLDWRGWSVRVIATPGHSRDHLAFAARRGKDGPLLLFCGDALAAPGKLWTPYTTDWDHWTDAGLKPTAASLRKLAALKPALVLPAHGEPIRKDCAAVLDQTAVAVEEVAFLKSFERYTKQRLGDAPQYRFLAKEQAESNGSKPWSQVSPHLFLTGNTYVLTSKDDNAFLVIDPWAKRGADQIAKLKRDRGLGRLEVVLFSHAHYDHYDGVYHLPDRDSFEVWALDRVAGPIAEPLLYRAPFLDARPVRFERRLKDGDTAAWREYRFRFHHLPGQTEFTSGVEAVIDGKRCYFTADNFFHQDQFSGTGGWMGLNRSFPLPYAASARQVLEAAPEWVLAEHGGPFEFNAEDFRRRVRWGEACATAADAVCVSGNHRHDWDPNRVCVRPLLQKARPGETVSATLVAANPLSRPVKLSVTLNGRGRLPDQSWDFDLAPGGTAQRELRLRVSETIPVGRQVFPLDVVEDNQPAGCDALFVIDIVR
jgi:glyoxylase-like metal-dependent hydrolase (beta-lactamase superfamily II)